MSTRAWTEVRRGRLFGPLAWSRDSRYIYFQDILEPGQTIRRMNVLERSFDSVTDFHTLLEGIVLRCGFEDVAPDGSPLVGLTIGESNVFSFEIDLP